MPRRTKATIIIVLLVLLLVALAAYLRRKAPPEAARLLPESDCILYFNLRPLRTYTLNIKLLSMPPGSNSNVTWMRWPLVCIACRIPWGPMGR
jgi:hypothetical protein